MNGCQGELGVKGRRHAGFPGDETGSVVGSLFSAQSRESMPAGKSETLTFFGVPLNWIRGIRGIDINYSKSWKCLCFFRMGSEQYTPSLYIKKRPL
jgi:hypothetical protein